MSRFRISILGQLVLAACLGCAAVAGAQTAAPTAGQAQSQAGVPALAVSPADAQQALAVLRDEKRRTELINTLDTIAKVRAPEPRAGTAGVGAVPGGGNTPAATPAATLAATLAGTPTAVAAAKSALPLEPDSLGVQFITQAGAALSETGRQLVASVQSVNDLPLLWRWLSAQFTDADARARDIDALWKLAAVLAAALGAEGVARLVLRRLRAVVSRGAHATPTPTPPDDPDAVAPTVLGAEGAGSAAVHAPGAQGLAAAEAGETEHLERERRLTGALSALKRLPFLFGRLLLDLVPLAVFATVGFVLLGTPLGKPESARLSVTAVLQVYLAARGVLAVAGMLVSPVSARLRLLHISDWAAAFLTRWLRRVVITGLAGFGVVQVGLVLGMYRTAAEAVLKLVSLAVHVFLVLAVLQAREPIARRIRARHATRLEKARRFGRGMWSAGLNRLADIWHLVAIFYIVALWLVWAVELRNGYVRLLRFFAVTAVILVLSRLLAVVLLGGLDRLLLGPRLVERHPTLGDRLSVYHRVLRALVMLVIAAVTGVALLEAWGFGVVGWFQTTGLGGRVLSAAVLITVTVAVAVAVWEGTNAAVESHLVHLRESSQLAKAGRLRTLLPMLRTALMVVIVLIVALTCLSELGVNIAPLLAGAGVIGIAVGFGSQKLVQDLITGVFLLLEDAMQVGDVVTLGGLSGTVEALSIRTIRLRALDGSVHIIPFSAVTTVTNQTRDYGFAVLDVSVGLNEEPAPISDVIRAVAAEMRAEEKWSSILLEPLDVMGVEKFTDNAWVLRSRIKTLPSSRWAVARELNRRIKVRFDELAIESPFTSHRVLSNVPGPPPGPPSPAAPPPAPPERTPDAAALQDTHA